MRTDSIQIIRTISFNSLHHIMIATPVFRRIHCKDSDARLGTGSTVPIHRGNTMCERTVPGESDCPTIG